MIRFKESVRISPETLRCREMIFILDVVQEVAPVGYDVTVTSGFTDGVAGHCKGKAWDFEAADFPAGASPQTWLRRVRQALGEFYHVEFEGDKMHVGWNG